MSRLIITCLHPYAMSGQGRSFETTEHVKFQNNRLKPGKQTLHPISGPVGLPQRNRFYNENHENPMASSLFSSFVRAWISQPFIYSEHVQQ